MFQVNPLLARQRIHMKNRALFSSKDKSKKIKCRLLQFLLVPLRLKVFSVVASAFWDKTIVHNALYSLFCNRLLQGRCIEL